MTATTILFAVFAIAFMIGAVLVVTSTSVGRTIVALMLCIACLSGLFSIAGFPIEALLVLAVGALGYVFVIRRLSNAFELNEPAAKQITRENRVLLIAIAMLVIVQVILPFGGAGWLVSAQAPTYSSSHAALLVVLALVMVFAALCCVQALTSGSGLAKELPGQAFRDQAMALRVKDVIKRSET